MLLIAVTTTLFFLMLVGAAYQQRMITKGFRALRLWERLMLGPLPDPEELEALGGRAIELLACARDEAARVAHVPPRLLRTARAVESRLEQIEALLEDWRLRLLGCGDPPPPPPPLAIPVMRLRRLWPLAAAERLWRVWDRVWRPPLLRWYEPDGVWLTYGGPSAGMYAHISVLRAALRLVRGAVSATPRRDPEGLPARLDALHADLQMLLRDVEQCHARLFWQFTSWRTRVTAEANGG